MKLAIAVLLWLPAPRAIRREAAPAAELRVRGSYRIAARPWSMTGQVLE